jgi:hypothetical protein
MEKFLIIDTEELRVKVKVTNTQINVLTPIIKKVNKDLKDYKNSDGYLLFKELINSISDINEDDITSINIIYQN